MSTICDLLNGDETGEQFKELLTSPSTMLQAINDNQNKFEFVFPGKDRSDECFKNSVFQIVLPDFLALEVAGKFLPQFKAITTALAAGTPEEAYQNLTGLLQFLNVDKFEEVPGELQVLKAKEGSLKEILQALGTTPESGTFTAESITELAKAIQSTLQVFGGGDANSFVEVPSKITNQMELIESQNQEIIELKEKIETLLAELAAEKSRSQNSDNSGDLPPLVESPTGGLNEEEASILNGGDPEVFSALRGSQRQQALMSPSTTPMEPRRILDDEHTAQRTAMEKEMFQGVCGEFGDFLTRSVRKCAEVASTPMRNGNDTDNAFGA